MLYIEIKMFNFGSDKKQNILGLTSLSCLVATEIMFKRRANMNIV